MKLRFQEGDMAILLYSRTFHDRRPTAGTIVHVLRVCVIDDAWDNLPCHYVVGTHPADISHMYEIDVRYVLDCQLMPLGQDEKDKDVDVEVNQENEDANAI